MTAATGTQDAGCAAARRLWLVLRDRLLAERAPDRSHWRGELSDSALATAIALVAWTRVDPVAHAPRIRAAAAFLAADINPDGGWGDSPRSPSNITASLLCWCALRYVASIDGIAVDPVLAASTRYLEARFGGVSPAAIEQGVLRRYGDDRTFAAPILMLCALTGNLGASGWERLPRLPFELALLPHGLFRWLNLTVVSYALPALIAIGLVRRAHRPSACRPVRWLHASMQPRLLAIMARMQPSNGGYEEAPPLTGFVAMSLAEAGLGSHGVVTLGCRFLACSQRGNGALPIDTDLANWVTVLAVQALTTGAGADAAAAPLPEADRPPLLAWLLGNQHDRTHPLTFGAPGGWAWSDCPGAMPDADDTAGTLLALVRLGRHAEVLPQAMAGIRWLLALQNRDGGIPTFSRGWGKLPFDRSCTDITAHALQAFSAWQPFVPSALARRIRRASRRMVHFLMVSEAVGGGWDPLWFGSQLNEAGCNRVHGTARVVCSLAAADQAGVAGAGVLAWRGARWLQTAQHVDGGWGALPGEQPNIEETALAVLALARIGEADPVARGMLWLERETRGGTWLPPAPIGLYFDQLWYAERLYPLTFALMAAAAAEELLRD